MTELVRGTVADRPWGRTFATLGMRGVNGQLTLTSDGKRFYVVFQHGAVVAAASPLAADAAVRIAMTGHLVSSSQVPEISRRQAAAPERDEIDVIADLARLGPDHALRLRRRVIAQRAARTFAINHGEFVVTDDIELPVLSGCELDVRAVLYMGARTNLSEQRLAAELELLGGWFRLKPDVDEDLPQFGFTDLEQPVVERLRDGGTVSDFEEFAASFVDARTVRAVVYALASYSACEVGPAPQRTRPGAPTRIITTQPLTTKVARPTPPEGVRESGRDDGVRSTTPRSTPSIPLQRVATPQPRSAHSSAPPIRAARSTPETRDTRDRAAKDIDDSRVTSTSSGRMRPIPLEDSYDSSIDERAVHDDPRRRTSSDPALRVPEETTANRRPGTSPGVATRSTARPGTGSSPAIRPPVDPHTEITANRRGPGSTPPSGQSPVQPSTSGTPFGPSSGPRSSPGLRVDELRADANRRAGAGSNPPVAAPTALGSNPGTQTDGFATGNRRTRTAGLTPSSDLLPRMTPRRPEDDLLRGASSAGIQLPPDEAGPDVVVRRVPSSRPPPQRPAPRTDSPQSHEVKALIAQRIKLLDTGADHFQLLGVSQEVSSEALRKAYFVLARQLHPDRLAALGISDEGKHAQRLFAHINSGFATLSEPSRRAHYVDVLRRGGEAAVRAEQARAEELARKILEAEEAFRRGEMAMRRDQPQAAAIELERAVLLNPEEADYHALLAWAQFCATGDKVAIASKTRTLLERAIQRSPKATSARFYLGRVERMLGRDQDALRYFREVLAMAPGHAEAGAEVRALESRLKR